MDFSKDNYVIVEVIPTHSKSDKGFIAQLSALKLNGIVLEDRFDYRVADELIENKDLLNMISYDKKDFKYVNDKGEIFEKFIDWIGDYPLILIDNTYTLDYLRDIKNKKELIYPYLNIEYTQDVFSKIIERYNLEDSNYLVDLVYEAIIYEMNHHDK